MWRECEKKKQTLQLMYTVRTVIWSWYIKRQIRFYFCLWDLKNKAEIYLVNPESVHGHIWECKNTEFVWELNWGFVKEALIRAVSIQECPLRSELPLYKTLNRIVLFGALCLLFYIICACQKKEPWMTGIWMESYGVTILVKCCCQYKLFFWNYRLV